MSTQTGSTTTITGDSTAVGENTLTTASVYVHTISNGKVTITRGKAYFTAEAQSSDGGTAYAGTYSSYEVTGSDIVVGHTNTTSSTSDDNSWSAERTAMRLVAVDIEAIDIPSPVVVEQSIQKEGNLEATLSEGNVAALAIEAEAQAVDSYVDVNASILTVEDIYSNTTLSVVVAVG